MLADGPRTVLKGQVRVEATPFSFRLTDGPDDEDWPASAQAPDGTVWVAYTAYRHAAPLDAAAIHVQRKFDVLRSTGHGDQLRLVSFDGQKWAKPVDLTEAGLDLWRPSVAIDGGGTIWVVHGQNIDDNWDLYAISYKPGAKRVGPAIRQTNHAGSDVNPVAVVSPKSGELFVVWQGWRDGNFDILLAPLAKGAADEPRPETRVSDSPANDWWPAAAFDSKGKLFVAFDTYDRGNYDVRLVTDAAGGQPRPVEVAAAPLFEARPSIVVDRADRVWVAYEEAGQNWPPYLQRPSQPHPSIPMRTKTSSGFETIGLPSVARRIASCNGSSRPYSSQLLW